VCQVDSGNVAGGSSTAAGQTAKDFSEGQWWIDRDFVAGEFAMDLRLGAASSSDTVLNVEFLAKTPEEWYVNSWDWSNY
jgi:hypothetical protein